MLIGLLGNNFRIFFLGAGKSVFQLILSIQ